MCPTRIEAAGFRNPVPPRREKKVAMCDSAGIPPLSHDALRRGRAGWFGKVMLDGTFLPIMTEHAGTNNCFTVPALLYASAGTPATIHRHRDGPHVRVEVSRHIPCNRSNLCAWREASRRLTAVARTFTLEPSQKLLDPPL